MDLVKTLEEIQKENGYTDLQMAERLGYSRPYYNQIRAGNVAVSTLFRLKAVQAFPQIADKLMAGRSSTVNRETKETNISLELNVDGSGRWEIDTGIKMLDHFLSQVAQHGRFDLKISATGDDEHHLTEDIAICLGKALAQALGEKQGIVRMGDALVPMDDALAMVAVDLSGRAYTVLELSFNGNDMSGFSTDLIRHFLESLAVEARLNLHAHILYGTNDHHRAEALFKALGRALDMATRIDERISGRLPSTKGMLEGEKE
jgi:imidazoleglycerol-phosphate dehydratase